MAIEKAVNVNAEQIQDYLKLVDVSKTELQIEFTKSLTELTEQLDEKFAGLSQSPRSEIADSFNKQLKDIDFTRQCVSALETIKQSCTPSMYNCRPMPGVSSVYQLATPDVGLCNTGMETMLAGTPVVTNSATVPTTNIVMRP